MNCQFEKISNNKQKCKICGYEIASTADNIFRKCKPTTKCQFERIDNTCKCKICNKTIDCEDCARLDMDCISAGLGDTIAKLTNVIGIQKCGGCEERQKILNKLFPY